MACCGPSPSGSRRRRQKLRDQVDARLARPGAGSSPKSRRNMEFPCRCPDQARRLDPAGWSCMRRRDTSERPVIAVRPPQLRPRRLRLRRPRAPRWRQPMPRMRAKGVSCSTVPAPVAMGRTPMQSERTHRSPAATDSGMATTRATNSGSRFTRGAPPRECRRGKRSLTDQPARKHVWLSDERADAAELMRGCRRMA